MPLFDGIGGCASIIDSFVECLNQGSVYGIICLLTLSFCDKATAEANRKK
jgi:hypothetical protein